VDGCPVELGTSGRPHRLSPKLTSSFRVDTGLALFDVGVRSPRFGSDGVLITSNPGVDFDPGEFGCLNHELGSSCVGELA
jgi:hypothetical protein